MKQEAPETAVCAYVLCNKQHVGDQATMTTNDEKQVLWVDSTAICAKYSKQNYRGSVASCDYRPGNDMGLLGRPER